MKRIAGEGGTCWTSRNTLAKQCGMSVSRLKKSLKYLVEHEWIRKIGTKIIDTKGGTQEVNEYKIVDLWKRNHEFYEGGSSENPPSTKGGRRMTQRGVADEVKGGSSENPKEEPREEEPINKNNTSELSSQVKSIMDIFYEINPSLSFGNRTVRAAAERMIKKYGLEVTKKMAEAVLSVQGKPYAPVATTPYQMEQKLAQFKIFFDREKQAKNTIG